MYSPVGCDINEAFRMSKRSRDRENPPLTVPLACVIFINDSTGILRGSAGDLGAHGLENQRGWLSF